MKWLLAIGAFSDRYPGLKWSLGCLAVAAVGLLIAATGANTVGIVVAVPAVLIAGVGWKSTEDFKRGWPPWPLSDLADGRDAKRARQRVRAADQAEVDKYRAETRAMQEDTRRKEAELARRIAAQGQVPRE